MTICVFFKTRNKTTICYAMIYYAENRAAYSLKKNQKHKTVPSGVAKVLRQQTYVNDLADIVLHCEHDSPELALTQTTFLQQNNCKIQNKLF